jgi:hypothetical protein
VGGCIAALDPGSAACGEAVQKQLRCMLSACDSCSVRSPADPARVHSVDVMNDCFARALEGVCKAEGEAAAGCLGQVGAGPAAACLSMDDNLDALFRVIGAMCGP